MHAIKSGRLTYIPLVTKRELTSRALTSLEFTFADSLRNQGIPFAGPTLTPMGRRIYVVDNYPFTESELVNLLESDELNLKGIRKLRRRIENK